MTGSESSDLGHELAEFEARVAGLRAAAATDESQLPTVLQACLAELDVAIDVFRRFAAERVSHGKPDHKTVSGERRLLEALFREFPVPGLVLNRTGTIRRANSSAARALGVPRAQLTGKPFPIFVELSARALFRAALSAAARSDAPSEIDIRLLRQGTGIPAHVVFAPMPSLGSETPLLLAAFTEPAQDGLTATAAAQPADRPDCGGIPAHAIELVGGMARLLLGMRTTDPPVILARAAELIAGTLGDLVIVDVVDQGRLRQAAVAGPSGSPSADVALVSGTEPTGKDVRCQVLESGRSVFTELIEDDMALGSGPDGVPILDSLNAVSLMCVPLRESPGVIGTLTCVRREGRRVHGFWDLRCLEESAAQLALALVTGEKGLY